MMIRNVISEAAPSSNSSNTYNKKVNKKKKKRSPVFPQRLYDMLEDAEQEGYSHLIAWSADGKSFKISYDDAKLSTNNKPLVEILQRRFNQTQFKSFLRQLQLYGFERQFKGSRRGECKHPLFQRGHKQLLKKKSIEDFQDATQNALTNRIITNNSISLLCSSLLKLPSALPSVAIPQQQHSAIRLNHRPVPYYDTTLSTKLTSTNYDTMPSYCTNGRTVNIPTRLTNLVLPVADDNQEDDATTERNESDRLSSNRKSNHPLFDDNYHDDCNSDSDSDGDDDVDMRDDNMMSVDNDIYNNP